MGVDFVVFGVVAVVVTRGCVLCSFFICKEVKDYGVMGCVVGALDLGDRVVIIEDIVICGIFLIEVVRVVREFGVELVMILVIVDRGGMCAVMVEVEGIVFYALFIALDFGFDYGI